MRHSRGFTLVELLMAGAIAALLSALAWPAWQAQLLRAARTDAVEALTRIQAAQESHRDLHGLYTTDLRALRGAVAVSAHGRYAIELASAGADAYTAVARAQGPQTADRDCAALSLSVSRGFPNHGPDARCWNR